MKLTVDDLIDDIYAVKTEGHVLRGIEIGIDAWDTLYAGMFHTGLMVDHAGNTFMPPAPGTKPALGCRLLGLPVTVVESLGDKIFYLVEPRSVGFVSRESLRKDAEHAS